MDVDDQLFIKPPSVWRKTFKQMDQWQVGEKSVMYFKKNEEPPKMKKMKQIDMSEETVSDC